MGLQEAAWVDLYHFKGPATCKSGLSGADILHIAQSIRASPEKVLFADATLPEPPQTMEAASSYLKNIQSRKVIPAA